ncbi:inositol-pentakisphosphate 2-kinase isoform X2 [Drosophila ananassae]|uniref:inositol-pentakisphosphate 2-kinase isoform X2 n=1 Tax=Drosophila ananassae TaxID=7217 RepID=UPI001CFFFAAA|nr:inositol-pentakisphosphate 2-kinase isoform X2 [Drosophila ananassae]
MCLFHLSTSLLCAASCWTACLGPPPAGDLTMPDFMAYIGIMRRLLGNEFVCGADIVAIPKEDDRFWINEQIRAHRPVSRLDKEFVGPFGLLLPDVTQLPATFDVLLANLQAKGRTGDGTKEEEQEDGRNRSWSGVRRLGDTYAIEIKPKQGWIQLASDVNDLFDLMPAIAETKPNKDTEAEDKRASEAKEQKDQEQQALTRDKCWCRYCNMQLLKLHNGKIKRLGHYCPLELFSGEPSRMLSALDALLACPQNNLRVFRDGNLIYGDHANSISFDELHSRVFPGEMMVLIKHLLVACLLREYEDGQRLQQSSSQEIQPTPSRDTIGQMETIAGAVNVDRKAEEWEAGCFVDAGQSSTRTRAAAATTTTETQRYTKLARIDTTTAAAATEAAAGAATRTSQLSGNVLAIATRTETKTETETLPTPGPSTSWNLNSNRNQNENEVQSRNRNENEPESEATNQTQAQINKAEIFRLPKNCVLQKILNLQLLVKKHFDFMWHSGFAHHSQRTYNSLRGLLSAAVAGEETELDLKPDPEQAYMLGATALDCSIMLTFQEIEIEWETDCPAGGIQSAAALQPWCVSLLGHHFLTKLSVLDLDPKPDSHFHKFIEQTREMEKCRRALN